MLARFDADVIRLSSRIVIILGGSNDLGWGIPPREVFSNLCEMYALSLSRNVIPIACTVPSILGFDEGIPPRIMLNELIREYCSGHPLQCADLFAATMDRATKRLASQYSFDGLHLNTRGYEKIGDTIYGQELRPVLTALFEDLRS
jgi:lysophospholipase L1-like esterase